MSVNIEEIKVDAESRYERLYLSLSKTKIPTVDTCLHKQFVKRSCLVWLMSFIVVGLILTFGIYGVEVF